MVSRRQFFGPWDGHQGQGDIDDINVNTTYTLYIYVIIYHHLVFHNFMSNDIEYDMCLYMVHYTTYIMVMQPTHSDYTYTYTYTCMHVFSYKYLLLFVQINMRI